MKIVGLYDQHKSSRTTSQTRCRGLKTCVWERRQSKYSFKPQILTLMKTTSVPQIEI
jgi:hypothetical protein